MGRRFTISPTWNLYEAIAHSLSGRPRSRTVASDVNVASECVAQMLIFGEAYLRRVLSSYATYCNEVRTHLALRKETPTGRTAQRSGKSSPSRSCAVCITIMPE